jgi:hypothetical protein
LKLRKASDQGKGLWCRLGGFLLSGLDGILWSGFSMKKEAHETRPHFHGGIICTDNWVHNVAGQLGYSPISAGVSF